MLRDWPLRGTTIPMCSEVGAFLNSSVTTLECMSRATRSQSRNRLNRTSISLRNEEVKIKLVLLGRHGEAGASIEGYESCNKSNKTRNEQQGG